jgi:hypothetical protein
MIHAALGLAFFSTARGSLVSGAMADTPGDAMTVSLVSLSHLEPSAASSTARALDVLTAKLASDAPAVYAPPDHKTSMLLAAPHENSANAESGLEPAQSAADRPNAALPQLDTVARGTLNRGQLAAGLAGGAPSTGALWGRIEPCWRSLGGHIAVPVSLEVALNANGQLARAPVILRGNAALDERQLSSEVAALQALSACLPQGDLRLGGQTYRLNFPAN